MLHQDDTPDPNRCPSVRALCLAFLDGELDTADAGFVRAHLNGCIECADFFDAQRDFSAALAGSLKSGAEAAPAALRARVLAGIDQADRLPRLRPWPNSWRVFAAAALIVLGMCAGVGATLALGPTRVEQASPSSLSSRVKPLCQAAEKLLPRTDVRTDFASAQAQHERLFPGLKLPRMTGEHAAEIRNFGSSQIAADTAFWALYCTQEDSAEMRQRFVLLTVPDHCLAGAMDGLDLAEMMDDGMCILIWRDRNCFRLLITSCEPMWAKQQMARLQSA